VWLLSPFQAEIVYGEKQSELRQIANLLKVQIFHLLVDLIWHEPYGAFTLDVKSVSNENLGGILGGTHC
jgi:hypothetical protein